MTTLYRSPNVVIDKHEWHVAVEMHCGCRPTTVYRFRRDYRDAWKPRSEWPGRLPKGFGKYSYFGRFRNSILEAIASANREISREEWCRLHQERAA